MAYQATILNVMIASPNDVSEERQLVRDAIYEWNAIHSKQFGVMLNPVGWETHIAPEMGSRPQEIINKSILNNSDILFGLFWTRLGSPTGEYVSGTVEEISKHCKNKKLASIYISRKSYPDNIDLQQLQLLRDQTQIWLKDGLLEFYDDQSVFKQKIKDHLSLHIQQNEYIQTIVNELNSNDTAIQSYTEKAIELSDEMITILQNAGKDEGNIYFIKHINGTTLSTGKLDINLHVGRELAKWENAVQKLSEIKYIKNQTDEKDYFSLTNEGWNAFDQLKEQIGKSQ